MRAQAAQSERTQADTADQTVASPGVPRQGGDEPAHRRDRGLLVISLFKLGKAIFFFALGLGAVHLMNKNLSAEVLRLAAALRRDPEGHLVHMVLEHIDLIDLHRLRQISLGSFAYSAVALTEGIGLLLEKSWAEYLTLILTISFLPWELFELLRDANWFRFGLLLINLLVLGYLVWLLQRKKRRVANLPAHPKPEKVA